jgi:hypothetical protein
MSFDDMFAKYGHDNLMVSKVLISAKRFQISYDQLIQWGREVRDAFVNNNLVHQQTGCKFGEDSQNILHKLCLDKST